MILLFWNDRDKLSDRSLEFTLVSPKVSAKNYPKPRQDGHFAVRQILPHSVTKITRSHH
ncbi:hypothetical protein NIES2104_61170 [Leptolyngbya sp. NIES-2104]|nr:hypothetical protein NIES2104_61170 [Leptolyngbya sp. NIES-2104]